MKLSKRLLAIANFVPKNSIVADIGTDHGYIPKYLIDEGMSKFVIATDISPGSLEKTVELIDQGEYIDKILARLGDGLEPIKPFEVDTLVIAGMGGILIRDILEQKKDVTDTIIDFIFQPMVASKELREYLYNNNFTIVDEDLVYEDDKYYEIIYARKGKESIPNEIYYEIGERLVDKKHPLLKDYLDFKTTKATKLIDSLEDKESEKSLVRIKELEVELVRYQEVYKNLEGK